MGLDDVRPGGRRGLVASAGAIGAAVLASLCCIGPLVFVAFGVGAGLASTFEPLRPIFTALTVGLLGLGFYTVYGRRPAAARSDQSTDGEACAPDGSCAVPSHRRRDKVLVWTAAVLALLLLTFPEWSTLLL